MTSISRKAYAKVNLALDVLRRREDGYHLVKMVMQNLNIYDELEFTLCKEPEDKPYSISIKTNKENIPTDGRNLIYKAAELMFKRYDLRGTLHINLIKNIPVEAGMAGGSTDCAATLHGINELFNLGLDEKTLMELGVSLGADVPYCVMAKTALAEGIGEILTPVSPLPDCFVLVAKPPVSVSTKMVYTNLDANNLETHPDVDGMIMALESKDIVAVASKMENVLETVTVKLHPEIEQLKEIMKEKGALNAIMSGSGPTVFGIYEDENMAKETAEYIRKLGLSTEIFVTTPV